MNPLEHVEIILNLCKPILTCVIPFYHAYIGANKKEDAFTSLVGLLPIIVECLLSLSLSNKKEKKSFEILFNASTQPELIKNVSF